MKFSKSLYAFFSFFSLISLLSLTFALASAGSTAFAHSDYDDRDDDHHGQCDHNRSCDGHASKQVSIAGPSPYHPVYAAIQNTKVTIQNFQLRGEDGSVMCIGKGPTGNLRRIVSCAFTACEADDLRKISISTGKQKMCEIATSDALSRFVSLAPRLNKKGGRGVMNDCRAT